MQQYPTYGYRRLLAFLRYQVGIRVNQKAVYRVLRIKQWTVRHRATTPWPRAQRLHSRTGAVTTAGGRMSRIFSVGAMGGTISLP